MIGDGFKQDAEGDYISKRPGSTLDYGYDWTKWIKGEAIVNSTWNVESGLVKTSGSHDNTATAVLISGGEAGKTYTVTNTIQTATLTDSRSFRLIVEP